MSLLGFDSCSPGSKCFFFLGGAYPSYDHYLEDHPRTCKWLITMVIVSPLSAVVSLPNGRFMACKWCLLTTYIHWDDPPTARREVSPSSYDPKPGSGVQMGSPWQERWWWKRRPRQWNRSGQISSRPKTRVFTLNGGLVREISFFQEIWVGEILQFDQNRWGNSMLAYGANLWMGKRMAKDGQYK